MSYKIVRVATAEDLTKGVILGANARFFDQPGERYAELDQLNPHIAYVVEVEKSIASFRKYRRGQFIARALEILDKDALSKDNVIIDMRDRFGFTVLWGSNLKQDHNFWYVMEKVEC